MKKVILMAALMVSTVAMYAQHAVGSLTIQPKVGLSIASLTDMDGSDPRFGAVAGAEIEYQLTDIFSLTGGALYSMQGGKFNEDDGSVTVKMDYINIPLLANVYVVKNLAVKAGIQPAFNVSSSVKAKVSGTSIEEDVDAKTFDFSIPIGLSYEINNIVIDGRYNFGLTKAFDGGSPKNSVFQFTVGYKFAL